MMFVWQELDDGDEITIRRVSGRIKVMVKRAGDSVVDSATVLAVRSSPIDEVVVLIRRLLQRVKNSHETLSRRESVVQHQSNR